MKESCDHSGIPESARGAEAGPVRTFLLGSGISLAGTLLLGLVNLLIRRTLSLGLSPGDYGMFYSCIALLSMIFAWSNLGIAQSGTALIAEYADRPERSDCFLVVFTLKMGLAILFFAGIALFAGAISRRYWGGDHAWLLWIMGAYYVSEACFAAFRALWEGLKRFATLRIFQMLTTVAVFSMLVLIRSLTLRGATVTFVCGSLLTSAVLLIYVSCTRVIRWKLPNSRAIWRRMLRMTTWLAVSTMLLATLSQMDTVMLTALKGTRSAAAYNIGLPIMQIVQSCLIFPAVFLPIAVQLCRAGEQRQLLGFVRWGAVATILAGSAAFFFFRFTGAFWIRLIFDARYTEAAQLGPWLCSGIVFFSAGNFFTQLLIGLGELKSIAAIAVAVCGLNVLLNYILIRKFDYLGAGGATFGSYFVFFAAALLVTRFSIRRV